MLAERLFDLDEPAIKPCIFQDLDLPLCEIYQNQTKLLEKEKVYM